MAHTLFPPPELILIKHVHSVKLYAQLAGCVFFFSFQRQHMPYVKRDLSLLRSLRLGQSRCAFVQLPIMRTLITSHPPLWADIRRSGEFHSTRNFANGVASWYSVIAVRMARLFLRALSMVIIIRITRLLRAVFGSETARVPCELDDEWIFITWNTSADNADGKWNRPIENR